MSTLGSAEVLGPPQARSALAKACESALELYK